MEKPAEVKLDPYHFTWDWDRRNDQRRRPLALGIDWPFLRQADRDRQQGWIQALGCPVKAQESILNDEGQRR